MASPFSTNELFLRSDRIAFGKTPPEVPTREERLLIVPDLTGYTLYFGLSSLVSTNGALGTLEAINPSSASFTFDNLNNRLGIGVSTPQYGLDIATTTGVRISGGMLIANAFGLQSVPTAALISTLPSYVFAPGTIPPAAIASTGGFAGISVPTAALFSTLPTSVFSPNTVPLTALQSTGVVYASSFIANSLYGDGFNISNIPLANINGNITGNFFQPNTIPLSSLASTGQIWIRDGSLFVPIFSTGQEFVSSINANYISTHQLITGTITASSFFASSLNFINLSSYTLHTSSIVVGGGVVAESFAGDGEKLTNLDPAQLNTVIPSDKFGYRLIAWDAINPYGTFTWIAGNVTFEVGAPVTVQGTLNVEGATTLNTVFANLYSGDGSGLYNLNAVSSLSLNSTVRGLGTAGYISSLSLQSTIVSTTRFIQQSFSSFSTALGSEGGGAINQNNLVSTVAGLGSSGYISSLSLTSTIISTTTFLQNTISSFSTSLGQIGGGTIVLMNLTSTVGGLGSAGYISSLSLTSSLTSTTIGLQTEFKTAGFLSSLNLLSTVTGLGSSGYISSLSLTSTVAGLGSSGYISSLSLTSSLTSTTIGLQREYQTAGFLSSLNLLSTVVGLGSAGYVSTASLISTTRALEFYISSFIDPTELASTILSTVSGIGIGSNLQSTVVGLGSVGYISSASLTSSLISTINYIDLAISTFSTAFGPGGITLAHVTSTVGGLGSAGYISSASLTSSLISTTNYINLSISSFSTAFGPGGTNMQTIISTVQGLGTLGYVSTASLTSSIVSTTNYVNLAISTFSTAFGPGGTNMQTIISTVQGLGSLGYISSLSLQSSLVSTVRGLGSAGYVSTASLVSTVNQIGSFFSSLSTSYRAQFNTVLATISALTVSSLTFGTGDGFLAMPDIRPLTVSTQILQTSTLQSFNLLIGFQSSQTAIQYWGLNGLYNNTVLAEQSTGIGTQEFVVFKGSSSSDQIRFQTTGGFRIETGVSARLWPSISQTATPSFFIDMNSNVGIQTALPGASLDVAGSFRSQTVSTQQIRFSSLFGTYLQDSVVSSLQITASSIFATLAGPTTTVLYEV